MATFVGSYVNKVDRKGRVSVPARFRTAVSGQAIVVYLGSSEAAWRDTAAATAPIIDRAESD